MASTPTPADFFGAGYSESGTGADHVIQFTTALASSACLAGVTEEEADPTTGDYRKVVFGILEMLAEKMAAATPVSARISCMRNTQEDQNGDIIRTFNFSVTTSIVSIDVKDEPPA